MNYNLNPDYQRKVFIHEIRHIVEHMPKTGYVLGLDMERHEIEIDAELFVREVAASYLEREVSCNYR
ncbi:MAG: hypothetical protein ACPL5F_04435 [Moorellaceae bacterium]